jgi:hypothetical protein
MSEEKLGQKEELERKKLQAEIDAINLPFYKRPTFYAALIPVVFGIMGLMFTSWSGFFDVKREQIAVEKSHLELDVKQLKIDSIDLITDYDNKKAELEERYQGYRDALSKENDSISDSTSARIAAIELVNADLSEALAENLKNLSNGTLKEEDYKKKLQDSYAQEKELLDDIDAFRLSIARSDKKYKALKDDYTALNKMNSDFKKSQESWVNVKKTKPPFDKRVLLYSENAVGWYNNARVGYFSSANKAYYIVNGRDASLTKQVTHWKYIVTPK